MTIPAQADVVVIGAGMSGLSAADHVRQLGHEVVVLEAGPSAGGLARAIKVGGEPVEAYYHHIFPQDHETMALLDRLGLADRLEWHLGRMSILGRDGLYPFDTPFDLLRFPMISVPARARVGVATALQLVRRDEAALDRRSVGSDAPRWFGRAAYDVLWRPLLEAKFGPEQYADVPMAWLVARIRQRAGARQAVGDRLGYLRGSLGLLISGYVDSLTEDGTQVVTSAKVQRLERVGDRWQVHFEHQGAPASIQAGAVVAATAAPILDRMVDLPAAYRTQITSIDYRGVVCVLLELDRSLSDTYWVNVVERLGLGCVGIIEHTNLIPSERYGGRTLVYLAHYVDRQSDAWSASVEELIAAVEPSFRRLNPAYDPRWIVNAHVTRDPFAQPIPQVGGSMPGLPVETGLPGLVHASLAHIYPDDRGVSLALRLGSRTADAADKHLRATS